MSESKKQEELDQVRELSLEEMDGIAGGATEQRNKSAVEQDSK